MTIHIGKTYYDILPPEQKSLWPSLHKLSELGFVLYGGTAIALQCGHRNSVDFDFFSSESLPLVYIIFLKANRNISIQFDYITGTKNVNKNRKFY